VTLCCKFKVHATITGGFIGLCYPVWRWSKDILLPFALLALSVAFFIRPYLRYQYRVQLGANWQKGLNQYQHDEDHFRTCGGKPLGTWLFSVF
jgi:hypothetical protein